MLMIALAAATAAARMELAFHSVDDAMFDTSRVALDTAFPCIDAEIAAMDAAAFHRAFALGAFADGDDERAARSFAAVREIQPAWRPPPSLMPENSPLREVFDRALTITGRAPLPEHAGVFYVDGVRANEAPDGRAFLLQAFAPDGSVVATRYCVDTGCLVEVEPVLVQKTATRREVVRRRWRTTGTAVGTGLLLAGAAGLMVSVDARADLADGAAPAEIDALLSRSRTGFALGIAGVGTGAAAVAGVWVYRF